MSPGPALVVLAAGLGSRYGGPKQLEAVGPGGETLMDYAVRDAADAGFPRVVFVVRPDMADVVGPLAAARWGSRLEVATALQRLDDLPPGVAVPPGRAKPWGTAHAVLAAEPDVTGAFAVVNADDWYGPPAYRAAAGFLAGAAAGRWALLGYRLAETLSAHGGVNRGVCRAGTAGTLRAIEEVTGIAAGPDGRIAGAGAAGPARLTGDEMVSMNFWCFTPDVFPILREGLARFLGGPGAAAGEYLLPAAVQEAIGAGAARVSLLEAGSRWFGITHPADRPAVAAELRRLHAAGGPYAGDA